jgi:tetratricopeptide (TPR) repeat protein
VESRAPFWLVVNRPQEWKWPAGIPQPSSERFSFGVIWIACFAPAGQPLPANFFERVKPVAAPNLIRDFCEKYQKAGLSAKGEEIALALSRSVPNRSQRGAALTWWASQAASRRPERAYAVAREAIALEPSHLNLTVYATICRKAGRLEEALDAVRRAIGQEPEKGYAPGMLGLVTAWQLDRRDEARWWAQYVLKHPEGYVGPKDSLADLVQARLSRLEAGGASRAADADLPAVP